MAISKDVAEQTVEQLRRSQRIVTSDLLSDVLGSQKYVEVAPRLPVRGTHVDKDSGFLLGAQATGAAR